MLETYTQEHRSELEELLASPEWQEAISSGLVDEVKAGRIEPGKTRPFIDVVVNELLAFNEERVKRVAAGGCRDEQALLAEFARWPQDLNGKAPVITFLGINVTSFCNFQPRCIYCNQPSFERTVGIDRWKKVIAEATADVTGGGPYIYITGGEPLLLGDAIWGDDGLVRFATQRAAAVNVNTNGVLITPEVALRFIKAGLSKLHVSLDSADAAVQDGLCGSGCFDRTMRGIYNVQLARDLVGVPYPVIHTNCVLTKRNLDLFPGLFDFILKKHKQTAAKDDPFRNDLFPHVIPVGGRSNDDLRPSEDEFRRFYENIWQETCGLWDAFQDHLAVPKDQKGQLLGYFTNPFLRVEHKGGLDAYVKASAEGCYGKLALARHCYVAPTQAAFTPDGCQFRCGSHAIRRLMPTGNVAEAGVFDSIKRGISGLDALPREELCFGCALATLYINQSVESKLKEKIRSILAPTEDGAMGWWGDGGKCGMMNAE